MDKPISVAIVGTGIAGLAAMKEFLEAGFDVTAFEKHEEVAGIWAYNEDPSVRSVAKSTLPNTSKYIVTPFKSRLTFSFATRTFLCLTVLIGFKSL
jgi:cation diffusion facilitator CzcD-associated flavoprotein CzcO